MSWFSDFLNPKKGYQDAENAIRNANQHAQGFQMPFQQAGVGQIGNLQDIINSLINPSGLQSDWVSGYEESPYAQQLESEAMSSGLDAASAMGLSGSSAALSNIQKGASNIMQADRQQYLNDLMQKYLAGAGISQGMFGTGANMGSQMGQQATQMGKDLAGLAYGKSQAGSNMLGKILGGIGGLGIDYLTGGMGVGNYGRGAWAPSWMS